MKPLQKEPQAEGTQLLTLSTGTLQPASYIRFPGEKDLRGDHDFVVFVALLFLKQSGKPFSGLKPFPVSEEDALTHELGAQHLGQRAALPVCYPGAVNQDIPIVHRACITSDGRVKSTLC